VSSAPEPTTDHGLDLGGAVKRAAFFVVVAAIAIALILTLPGVGEIRDRLANATHGWIALAALCSILSMLGFVRALWSAFDRVMAWRRALVLGLAEQGANVLLPAGGAGGPAYGAYVLTRLGVPADLAAQRHAALFLVTSAVSFAAIIVAGTLTAIGLLPGDVALMWTLGPAAAIAVLFVLVVLFGRSDPPAEPEGGRVRHFVWRIWSFTHDGVRTSLKLVLHGDPLLIVGSVTYFAFDVASLACMFQAFGGGAPDLGLFVLAYALGHAGALIPTPGGVGGTEGGLIGAFVAYGTSLPLAAAAVVGYRVFQLGLPALFGAIALVRVQQVLANPPPREEIAARYEAHRWR
jgi:uncharacterized membrane protein YbhN (UPF0104 family)